MCLVYDPDADEVKDMFQLVWYKVLPALKVNHNIRTEWRILPHHYQGLELPNPNINILPPAKIHTINSHLHSDSVTGNILRWAYQAFWVETGIFARSFDDYGDLASHGWFKHFWQLCDRYQVVFCIA